MSAVPIPITGTATQATDFAPILRAPLRMPFGMDPAATAAGLRRLAAKIEAGTLVPETLSLETTLSDEDYPLTVLTLRFRESM